MGTGLPMRALVAKGSGKRITLTPDLAPARPTPAATDASSGIGPEYQNRRIRPEKAGALGNEQPVKLGHEQRCPRAGARRDPGQQTMGSILAAEHVDVPA